MPWNAWTDEECRILQDKYKEYGTNIPELLKRHSSNGVKGKAAALGLTQPMTPTIIFQGKPSYMRAVVDYYGMTAAIVTNALKAGWTHQDFVDRLELMHIEVDGRPQRTVEYFARPDSDYIYRDGKLWTAAFYCKHYQPGWTPAQYSRLRSLYRCTAQEAFDRLEDRVRYAENIKCTAIGYLGTNGKKYCFMQCKCCDRVLIVTEESLRCFRHDESFCSMHEVPEGVGIPDSIRYPRRER